MARNFKRRKAPICSLISAAILLCSAWQLRLIAHVAERGAADDKSGCQHDVPRTAAVSETVNETAAQPEERSERAAQLEEKSSGPSAVDCHELLARSEEQSRAILARRPELLAPEFETGKTYVSTDPDFPRSTFDREELATALDPNLGTKIIARSNPQVLPNFTISMHRPDMDQVRWGIFNGGEYYEKGITANFLAVLNRTSSGRRLMLDVGMNIGWFSLVAAAAGADVIAFDPNPLHHVRVCQSLLSNAWYHDDPDLRLFQHLPAQPLLAQYLLGVGDKPARLTLNFDIISTGSASLSDEPSSRASHLEVDVLTLDSFARAHAWLPPKNVPPAPGSTYYNRHHNAPPFTIPALKIDVEGFEHNVLLGARDLLASGIVETVFMEFTLRSNDFEKGRSRARDCVRVLAEAGLRLVYVTDYSGLLHNFKQARDSNRTAFPMNSNEDGYVDLITDWIFNYGWFTHKKEHVNVLWVRNGLVLEGILKGF